MITPGRKIVYHPLVIKKDILPLNQVDKKKLRRAIETKLNSAPEVYGLPLRGTLKKLWKLRVGDYRIVYEITADQVPILVIAHRRHVYEIADKR